MGSFSYQGGQSDRGANGRIRGLLRCCSTYIFGAMLTTICIGIQASEPRDRDISVQLAELRGNADQAVLYIGPHPGDISFPWSMKEKDLPTIGCTYAIGKEDIPELLDLLEDVSVVLDQAANTTVNARTGVFIYAGKRLMAKWVFADAFPNKGMLGLFNGNIPVVSGLALQSKLREFAEKHPPSSTHYGCEKDGIAIKPLPRSN